MRLKKEIWLVEEHMRHVQKEHKVSMKAKEQKCLQEERCKRMNEQDQLLSEERLDLNDDEIEEEKPKLLKRKLEKLSRMTVAKLQQKVNLKASSNIIIIL
ncbi:hypothetical protein TNIN_393431 [Trichonephila inaurata madagascariensis]|uniref:Uncharacterized protein n=1 Tax=Trichonephila inaurata madagascariensis TaxID=2747483 RepID=A0A8X6YWJ8_9ARAC|nr:hypothetical protein TNIN_393431 [Trichonephila inaurata madagascariensis]